MVMSRTTILAALAVLSCVDASWYPWTSQQQRSELDPQQAPNNDINIHHSDNASTICLRLSASISIDVQYKTDDGQNATVQVIVPHLSNENVEGSCGPDAYVQLSWTVEATTTEPPTEDPVTPLRVEETPWVDLTIFADVSTNKLRFEFVQLNDSYYLANITGVINIVDVPEGYPADSTVIALSVAGQRWFEAPLGVAYMCYGATVLQADVTGDLTAVSVSLTDVQLIAYYDESFWPNEVMSCNTSGAAKPVYFVLGAVVAVLVTAFLW